MTLGWYEGADIDAEQRFRATVQNKYVESVKSAREAHEAAAALKERGFKNTSVFEPKDLHHRGDDLLPTHLLQLASTLERR